MALSKTHLARAPETVQASLLAQLLAVARGSRAGSREGTRQQQDVRVGHASKCDRQSSHSSRHGKIDRLVATAVAVTTAQVTPIERRNGWLKHASSRYMATSTHPLTATLWPAVSSVRSTASFATSRT